MSSSASADFFFKDQFHGHNIDGGEDLEPFVGGNCYTSQNHSPMTTRVNASITPESFQSYHNSSQENHFVENSIPMKKEGVLQESPFDLSDYDESINFGIGPVNQEPPQQIVNQQIDPENVVKSEYSPVFPVSVSSSGSQSDSYVNKGEVVDFFNDDYDDLVRDDFGGSGMHDTNGRVGKKRKEKTSHNVIEKKYRTNINDKIFQLREIVPTLRFAYKRYSGMPILSQDADDLDGLEPARKLNKASILLKTIEYIQHLESKCRSYRGENHQLKNNIPNQDDLRQQAVTAAASATIPSGQRATSNSNIIPSQSQGQFDQIYDSPTYSGVPSTNSRPESSAPSNNSSYNGDFASKFLMGGMALTMGASCFGDNGDMGSARALFAMPVFRFSPQSGFVISNSHGAIDLQASIFSLLRLSLVFMAGVYLLKSLLFNSGKDSGKKTVADSSSIFSTRDTVQFDTVDHLKQTLRKTLIINRLKYKLNSMERIESKIAKCFAIKIYFQESSLSWSFFSEKYVNKIWEELTSQVNAANVKSKGQLRMGLEWDMITNITTAGKKMTLDNPKLMKALANDEKEYDLKEFISLLNSYILREKTEDMLIKLLKNLVSNEFNEWGHIIDNFKCDELDGNDILQSIPEKNIVLDCLVKPGKESLDKLSKWIEVNKDETAEGLLNEKLVLYGSIMRHLIESKRFDQCQKLMERMPLRELDYLRNSISIVGFTSVYLMLNSIFENVSQFRHHSTVLETVCAEIRVWLGSSPGGVLKFSLRSKLISYCISKSLLCDSLTQYDDEIEVSDDQKAAGQDTDDHDTEENNDLTDVED